MRETLSNILEQLSSNLEEQETPKVWRELMMHMVSDAGYRVGVAHSAREAKEAVSHIRGNLCILSKIMSQRDQQFESNKTVMGAWAACDTLGDKVSAALLELTKDQLH